MSTISARIRDRYDRFCDYFADHAFGSRPPDLTVLSLLPPVDRCLILERVLEFGSCDFPTCIDKLSMARFSWMFLEGDVARLMDIFPGVAYRYGAWVQMQAVFHVMDRILNQLARRAVGVYPFMNCEFTGW